MCLRLLLLLRTGLSWAASVALVAFLMGLVALSLGIVGGIAISHYMTLLDEPLSNLARQGVIATVATGATLVGLVAGFKFALSFGSPLPHPLSESFDDENLNAISVLTLRQPLPTRTGLASLRLMALPACAAAGIGLLGGGLMSPAGAHVPLPFLFALLCMFLAPSLLIVLYLPHLQKLRFVIVMGSGALSGSLTGLIFGYPFAGMVGAVLMIEAFSTRTLNGLFLTPVSPTNPPTRESLATYCAWLNRHHDVFQDDSITLFSYDVPPVAGAAPFLTAWNPGPLTQPTRALLHLYAQDAILECPEYFTSDPPSSAHGTLALEARLATYPEIPHD